jgi:cell filamentation protein
MFAHHGYIEAAAQSIFEQLARERHLAGLEPEQFSQRAGYFLRELNALHPFREGNGRVQREFISHVAHGSGYYIAWENMSQPKMLEASIESFNGDSSKLAQLI